MKKIAVRKRILAGLLAVALIVPNANVAGAKTKKVLETDVTEASEGCTLVGVYGSYFAQAKEALAKINAIRKEACEAGNVRDPRDPGRYLTASDYVPLKWSSDLENIARIRAAEAGIAFRFMDSGHNRLNEKNTFSITSNGISSSSEDLAYYHVQDMIEGILLWYSEKQYWVKQDFSEETGHYTSMINPKFTYVGFGGFYSEAAPYPATMAGEFSAKSDLDETMQEAPADVMQKIEVSDNFIRETYLDGDSQIFTGGTTTVTTRVKLRRKNALRDVWSIEDVTYTSSDPSVATVTAEGLVTGMTDGTVTITAKSGSTITAQKEITVKCNHPKKMTSYTESTCTKEGKKQYYCAVCQNTIEETVAKKEHDYVYGAADSQGKSTGKCSVCGDTIRIAPPTQMTLYWRNSTSSKASYSKTFPASNPVGSLLYCWKQLTDGDSDYQNMVMKSTNEEVAAAPEEAENNTAYDHYEILAEGITELSVYPKYNPRIKKTFMLRVGEEGSQDISEMDVRLSKDTFTYDGNVCSPEVTVSYRQDTVLEQGIDYMVSYENNVNAGTATAVISGKGLFYGTIRKDFTICKKEEESHTHETVIDEAVAATCTGDGLTQGSHCSKCGEILEAQTVIPALGHDWEPDFTIDIPATAMTQGEKSIHCRRCGERSRIVKYSPEDEPDASNGGNSGDSAQEASYYGGSDDNEDTEDGKRYYFYFSKGSSFKIKGIRYQINAVNTKKGIYDVTCMGSSSKKIKKITVPNYVKYKGIYYRVTGIGKNAFAGCRKVKTIKIQSMFLKKKNIGKNAFRGIPRKATVYVPPGKMKTYRKWLKKAGLKG